MRAATVFAMFGALQTCALTSTDGQTARLELTVTGALQTAVDDSAHVARVSVGEAVIDGVVSTPNPCYQIAATLHERGDSLTVRLAATPRGGGACIQTLGAYTYQARITDLARGTYSIAVIHSYPATGWEDRTHLLRAEIP